jgi:hypothetical protein
MQSGDDELNEDRAPNVVPDIPPETGDERAGTPQAVPEADVVYEVPDIDTFIDSDIAPYRKDMLEKKRQAASHAARAEAGFRKGDLEEASKSLGRFEGTLLRLNEVVRALNDKVAAYPVDVYLSRDFHQAFMEACKSENLAVEGAFPQYEVFPFRVRVSVLGKSVEVNERKVRILRPKALAQYLSKQKSAQEAANFDAQRFVDAVARVYDLLTYSREASIGAKMSKGLDLPLMTVYETLTLLPSQRRAYPVNMLAFDLHRLFVRDVFSASDGRVLVLGDTRIRGQRIVTYDASGREHRFGSVRFEGKGTVGVTGGTIRPEE